MKRFALIGAAGYIAPRHMKAILETNNELVAALDQNDSVGVLDSYFPKCDFFVEFERFDRHIDKLRRKQKPVDYLSICSPNYLHDSHIRFGLRSHAHVICEKPLVLNPWNIESLIDLEQEFGKKVYSILQLRLHPAIQQLKEQINNSKADKTYDVDLTYLTSRGNWYDISWKGNPQKSGGIASNIGIHFFDMLIWVFGNVLSSVVHIRENNVAAGILKCEKANIRWFLSTDDAYLPEQVKEKGGRTYRSIQIDGHELEFSSGFTDLHTLSYEHILSGKGFSVSDARPSIDVVNGIRNSPISGMSSDFHPYCLKKEK